MTALWRMRDTLERELHLSDRQPDKTDKSLFALLRANVGFLSGCFNRPRKRLKFRASLLSC